MREGWVRGSAPANARAHKEQDSRIFAEALPRRSHWHELRARARRDYSGCAGLGLHARAAGRRAEPCAPAHAHSVTGTLLHGAVLLAPQHADAEQTRARLGELCAGVSPRRIAG
jgi:hypothetical protein